MTIDGEAAIEQLIAAAKNLRVQYLAYQKTPGSCEDAYYKLAKYAYNDWKLLMESLSKIEPTTSQQEARRE